MGCGSHSKLPAAPEEIDSSAPASEQKAQESEKEAPSQTETPLPVTLGTPLGDPNKSSSEQAGTATDASTAATATADVVASEPAACSANKDTAAATSDPNKSNSEQAGTGTDVSTSANATADVAVSEPAAGAANEDVAAATSGAIEENHEDAIAKTAGPDNEATMDPTAASKESPLTAGLVVENVDVQEADTALLSGASINLPGRVKWIPNKKPLHGPFCGSSLVNAAPEDRSILCRQPEGILKLQAVLLFVNPNGGKKRGAELGERAVATFRANSVCVTVVETTHARHAEEYLRDTQAAELKKFQAVVGIGGDGTMSEMINGMMAREDGFRLPLGLLAGGTGNSFMGDLQEWDNMGGYDNNKLLDTLEETVTSWCACAKLNALDLGKVTFGDSSVRYSFNCVLMGLGVEANVLAEQVRFLGPARYDVGAIGAIAMNRHRTYTITIDGTTVDYPASIVGIFGTQSATFRMAPGAKVDDGLLDFSGLSPMPRGTLLHVFDEMKRDGAHIFEDTVSHHRGKRIEIASADGADLVNVDGENCGCAPLVCEVVPGAVQFLTAGAQK